MPDYQPGVTLITCTGGRPEAFWLCAKFVMWQTRSGLLQWIIVDDTQRGSGRTATLEPNRVDFIVTGVTPKPCWQRGQNTLARNLLAAIPEVRYDKILFIEDDDWYSPDYVSQMAARLDHADLVGESHARYYHIPSRRYWQLNNMGHASLCQTGMRAELLPLLAQVCKQGQGFLDVLLWGLGGLTARHDLQPTQYSVGIKGLPGRPGIGIGHRPERSPRQWTSDPNLEKLREWIGEDVELYRPFLLENSGPRMPQTAVPCPR